MALMVAISDLPSWVEFPLESDHHRGGSYTQVGTILLGRYLLETTGQKTTDQETTGQKTTDQEIDCTGHPQRGDIYSAECPCRDVLDLVASKWSALIIGRLQPEPLRFGELRRAIPGITQKMLTQTLRRLEADGLVHRQVFPTRPPQVEYSLSDLGRSAAVPLATIRDWAEDHLPEILAARQRWQG